MNGGVNCTTVQIHLMPLNCILLNVFLNGKFLKNSGKIDAKFTILRLY